MSSLFRHEFGGAPISDLFSIFGDNAVEITYQIGSTTMPGIVGLLRAETSEESQNSYGDINKTRRRSVVISTDPTSRWGGVADPQLQSIWTITEADGTSTQWQVDPLEGRGIAFRSDDLAEIHLTRIEPMSKSYPGSRVR